MQPVPNDHRLHFSETRQLRARQRIADFHRGPSPLWRRAEQPVSRSPLLLHDVAACWHSMVRAGVSAHTTVQFTGRHINVRESLPRGLSEQSIQFCPEIGCVDGASRSLHYSTPGRHPRVASSPVIPASSGALCFDRNHTTQTPLPPPSHRWMRTNHQYAEDARVLRKVAPYAGISIWKRADSESLEKPQRWSVYRKVQPCSRTR